MASAVIAVPTPAPVAQFGPERAQAGPGSTRAVSWLLGLSLLALAMWIAGKKNIGMSADLRNYELLYLIAAVTDWPSLWASDDPGFYSIAKLFAEFRAPFETFAMTIAAVTLILKADVLRKLDTSRLVLIVLYGSYLFWLHEYTQIRLALALAFVLQGIYGQQRYGWAWFVPAALCHASTVLIIGLFMALRYPRLGAMAFAAASGMYIAFIPIRDLVNATLAKFLVYQDLLLQGQFAELNLFSIMPAIQVITLGLALFFWQKLSEAGRRELIMSGVGSVSFYSFLTFPVVAFRISELFLVFFVIMLSRLWSMGIIFKGLAVVYVAIGLRTTFFSETSLIIPV
jgi:hypothetical protein